MYLFDYNGRQVFNLTQDDCILFAIVTSGNDCINMCDLLNLQMEGKPSAGVYYFDEVEGVVRLLTDLNTPSLISALMEVADGENR